MLCKGVLAAAVLAGAVLPLSACGGDARGSTSNTLVRVPSNVCALLTASDISEVIGRPFPAPRRFQAALGEQDCTSVPASGPPMSFALFWGNCVDGKEPNMDCLNSVSGAFDEHKRQTAGPTQPITLDDHSYCVPGPFATVRVLRRWIYLTVVSDTCPQAQKLAGTLLTKLG
jgi:hypothetical protein